VPHYELSFYLAIHMQSQSRDQTSFARGSETKQGRDEAIFCLGEIFLKQIATNIRP